MVIDVNMGLPEMRNIAEVPLRIKTTFGASSQLSLESVMGSVGEPRTYKVIPNPIKGGASFCIEIEITNGVTLVRLADKVIGTVPYSSCSKDMPTTIWVDGVPVLNKIEVL